jgi:hypothetical protein
MTATGNIGGVDQGHDAPVITHAPGTESLAHIAVQGQV